MQNKSDTRKAKNRKNGKNGSQPVVQRTNKLEKRMDRLENKVDALRNDVDALRKDTAREFKKARKETADEFKASRKEMKKEVHGLREEMAKYHFATRDENRIIADGHARTLTKVFTTMDGMAKDYSRWLFEKQITDAQLTQHTREISALEEKDATRETTLQDLQKRVVALEDAKNGKPTSPEPVSKLEVQH